MELADAPASAVIGPPGPAGARGELPPAIVSMQGLTKRFAVRRSIRDIARLARRAPAVTVVDHVTLDVLPGEVFGLLGPNGAGKTTIFKMLSTMIAADEGTARVASFDARRDPASVRGILASVPADERSLNWRLSARQNLFLFAALQHVAHADTPARVDWALRTVALSNTGDKRVGEFSSGMRQRLLIARALLTKPKVLLLDEPTRTLDPLSARELRRFLREELVEQHRCTIVLATHNTDEAFGFCDRVAVLHHGRVLATGTAGELAARFGEERYRVLMRSGQHAALAALEQCGVIERVGAPESTSEDWAFVDCTIVGGPARSSDVLRALVTRGVEVARLERIEPSLADLISRIIGADGGAKPHA